MRTIEELFEQAKKLPPEARRMLRDRLDEDLEEEERSADTPDEGPYASLLELAGTAHSTSPDVSVNKNQHLAEIYARKRGDR